MAASASKEINYVLLGSNIKEARIRCGLTQEQLAELTGLSSTHISNIENCHTKMSLAALYRIADVLGTGLDLLFRGQFENSSQIRTYGLVAELHELSPSGFTLAETLIRDVALHEKQGK